MHPTIDAFDGRVDAAFDFIRGPAFDRFFFTLSSTADHSLLWFGIGTARSLRQGDLRFAARFAVAIGLESAVTNGAIKSWFRRARPATRSSSEDASQPNPTGRLPYGMHRPRTTSFPSGHATAAFTAATLLSGQGPRRAPWFVLAALVAASRVYVRMHHASDILGGAVLGLLLGRALRGWVFAEDS